MIGRKYGRLTVLQRVEEMYAIKPIFRCVCDCGNETIVYGQNLRSGYTKSCGCIRSEMLREARLKQAKRINGLTIAEYAKKHDLRLGTIYARIKRGALLTDDLVGC